MEDSFIIMTKQKILERLEKAEEKYKKNLPAWQERCWQMYYELNEEVRSKWWAHFGRNPPLTMEEFKTKARAHWEKVCNNTSFTGFPYYWCS